MFRPRLRRSPFVHGAVVTLMAFGADANADEPRAEATPSQVAEQVRALEAAVETDQDRLLLLVSTPRAKSAPPLHEEPELKEIARRLPALQAKLARWADVETPQRGGQAAQRAHRPPRDAATKAQP